MIRIIVCALCYTVLALATKAVYAESNASYKNDNWVTECIGKYQLNVPSKVEIATNKPASFKGASTHAIFADGQDSPFSKLEYFGELRIISPVAEPDYIEYKKHVTDSLEKLRKKWLSSSSEINRKSAQAMKPMTIDTPTLFGWDSEDSMPGLFYFLDNKIFIHRLTNFELDDLERRSLNKKHFDAFLKGFRQRSLYEIPKQQGICIPYGFIADDGTTPRNIAVTMRLTDHPDVEIGFQDSTYFVPTVENGKLSSGYREPKDAINSFFNNSGVTNNLEKVESNFPGYHSIKMDGQKGGAVFFTIIREDKSKDYGYIAAVKGDDKAGIPSQLLYVIGTASHAKGKPVNKVELKDMAEKIMASVKKHPVQ